MRAGLESLRDFTVIGLMLAGLGACSSQRSGPLTGHTDASQIPAKAVYKVGNPYEINGTPYYPSEDYAYNETGIASWYGPGFHAKLTANGEDYDQNELSAAHRTLPMPSFVRVTNLDNGRVVILRINDRGPYARGRILDVSRRGAQLLGFDHLGTARVRVQILPEESRHLANALRAQGRTAPDAASKGGGAFLARASNDPKPAAAPRSSISVEPLNTPNGVKSAMVAPFPGRPNPPSVASAQPPSTPLADPTGPAPAIAPKPTQLFVQVAALSSIESAHLLSRRLVGYGQIVIQPVTASSGQRLHRVRIGPLTTVEEGDRTLDEVINRGGYPDARLIVD